MLSFESESKDWSFIQSVVSQVRSLRSQAGVPPKEKVEVSLKTDAAHQKIIKESFSWISRLAGVSNLICDEEIIRPEKSLMAAARGFVLYVPVGAYLDFEKEKKRLESEKKRIEGIVKGLKAKVGNKNFMDRAPEDVVVKTREQLENMGNQLREISENISSL